MLELVVQVGLLNLMDDLCPIPFDMVALHTAAPNTTSPSSAQCWCERSYLFPYLSHSAIFRKHTCQQPAAYLCVKGWRVAKVGSAKKGNADVLPMCLIARQKYQS